MAQKVKEKKKKNEKKKKRPKPAQVVLRKVERKIRLLFVLRENRAISTTEPKKSIRC